MSGSVTTVLFSGDWNMAAKTLNKWADGLNGWQVSDPWEQGWQKHLFDVVNTNAKLPTYGSSGKITLPPVPQVDGASGSYLYLKDCGEFDTEKYNHDLNYLSYAFGLPVGVKGKDANFFIDNILLDVVGIAPQKGGSNCLSATGNTNGLHVYNDYDWNLVSKEVLASDGNMVKFGWSFQGGDAKHGADAAFWILKDAGTGQIINSGLLAQGSSPASGIAEVVLPSAGGCGHYVLTIGQMNVGTYNADQGAGNPHMLLGELVQDTVTLAPSQVYTVDSSMGLGKFEMLSDWYHDGLGGWETSDPWEQGWQDYLYEYVSTNVNLHTWGCCGKITLPPVPQTLGGSNSYLYLKDCGEFDTQDYNYDLNYLNYAFGLPVGVKGKEANNYVDDILLNIVGIAPQKGGSNCLSATGNTNGLHAYNDYDWNLVSRQVHAPDGGMVQFGWSFQGGDAKHGDDAAFWILKDAVTGKVITGDLLAQGHANNAENGFSGIAKIPMPQDGSGHYILTIGQMNVGTYNGDQGVGNPHMLIGEVVVERMASGQTSKMALAPGFSFPSFNADADADADAVLFDGANDAVPTDIAYYDVDAGLNDLELVGTELSVG
jgi:hypothetical protein